MTLLTYLVALGAALLLLGAGYLHGVRKGAQARQSLRQLNRGFAKEIALLRDQAAMPRVNDEGLRATLQDILSPLVQRERLSYEMSRLESGKGQQRNLTAVLDQMADKGNFSSVLLSDAQGWRIAASSSTQDAEKLGATASLLLLMADRISRDGSPTPLALMLYDTANTSTLCRVFNVDNHRMTLTVVASGAQLTPAAIDPALVKLNAMLLNKAAEGSNA
ncbi:MAG: hypothetical protein IPJ08_24335 [Burkholderiales bacterium]|nr:hypothetical protein [Burkholderiales bacterium]